MIWNRQKWVLAIPAILFLPSIASEFTLYRIGLPGNGSFMISSPDSIDHIPVYTRRFGPSNPRANERHDTVK
jgi:hypothetical protein